MSPELERLKGEAMLRYHTDARFRARVRLAIHVEEELEDHRWTNDRAVRHERLERLVTVLHALDQDDAYRASIRYVGPPL